MKFFLQCLLVLFATVASGQNYQLIQSNSEKHFQFDDEIIYSIRIDSAIGVGSDSVLFNHKILVENYDPPCLFIEVDSSWIGSQILSKADGDYYFFNEQGDSLLIKSLAQLNDVWQVYQFPNGDYMEATLDSVYQESILGIQDSVKMITLKVKDPSNSIVSHPFNDKTILISKSNGIVQFFNVFDFPSNPINSNLVGASNPNRGIYSLSAFDIYNYDIGDEFHIDFFDRSQVTFSYFTSRNIIQKVIDKTIVPSQDTVYYTFEICKKERSNSATGLNEFSSIDTIVANAFVNLTVGISETLTGEVFGGDETVFSLNSEFGGRRQITKLRHPIAYSNSLGCWELLNSTFQAFEYKYYEGLGGTYYDGHDDHNILVYYKKGLEEWGTPYDCSTLLNTTSVSTTSKAVAVFPNPFLESTSIELSDFKLGDDMTFSLFDVSGRVVRSFSIQSKQFQIQKEDLQSGMYFYQITSSQSSKMHSGKIVIE